MAQKLFIGDSAFSTSTERLRRVFAQAGVVESAAVVTEQLTGYSRGFGFVLFLVHGEITASDRTPTGDKKDLDELFRGRLDSHALKWGL
jgi:hypothetical protein